MCEWDKLTAMVVIGKNTIVSSAMNFICELSSCMDCEIFLLVAASCVLTRLILVLRRLSSCAK